MATAEALFRNAFHSPAAARANFKADPSGLGTMAQLMAARLSALERRPAVESVRWEQPKALEVAAPGTAKS